MRCGAGGILLWVWAPLLPACSGKERGSSDAPEPEPEPEPGPPYAVGAIISDPALCGACSRCTITCSALRGEGPGAARGLVGPDAIYQQMQFQQADWFAATCRMCPEIEEDGRLVSPACVAACPRGAARIAEQDHPLFGDSRVRYIDPELCIGCAACVRACPFDHPIVVGGHVLKCDLCVGKWAFPPCVDACPSAALLYISPWSEDLPRPFPWERLSGDGDGDGDGEGGSGSPEGGGPGTEQGADPEEEPVES